MGGGVPAVISTTPSLNLSSPSVLCDFMKLSKLQNPTYPTCIRIQCCSSSPDISIVTEKLSDGVPLTGGAWDFRKATISLSPHRLSSPKKVTLVRHGLSSWNYESRVQGSSDLSVLTDVGVKQAKRCREALTNIHFDKCFSSPISRAKSTAEVMWQEREEPIIFLDTLKEAHLFHLEGMTNAFGGRGC